MMIFTTLGLGVLGVGLRYFLDSILRLSEFPVATFTVNILGCFIAGWVSSSELNAETRIALIIGFCGGLTTFSSFIIQCLQFMKDGFLLKAFVYLLVSLLAGFLAAWAGMKITHVI